MDKLTVWDKITNNKIEDSIIIYRNGFSIECNLGKLIENNNLTKHDLKFIYKLENGYNTDSDELKSFMPNQSYGIAYKLVNGENGSKVELTAVEVIETIDNLDIDRRGCIVFNMRALLSMEEEAIKEYEQLNKDFKIPDRNKMYSVTEFSELIKVNPNTLRSWDKKDILKPSMVMPDGKRMYTYEQSLKFIREYNKHNNTGIGYIVINSEDEKENVKKHIKEELSKVSDNCSIIFDYANVRLKDRRGFSNIIDMAVRGEIRYLVISLENEPISLSLIELLEILLEKNGVKLIVI